MFRQNRFGNLCIIQQLLQREKSVSEPLRFAILAERLIAVLAATAGVFLLGTYLQELLWALIAGGTVCSLGFSRK